MWEPGKDELGDLDPRLEAAVWREPEPLPPEPIPPELERDALRAEVEVLRRDIAELRAAFWNIALNLELSQNMNPDQMRFALENIRAISEARKDKEGEG